MCRCVRGVATEELHANDPLSVMIDQFTNFTCQPDRRYPCSRHGYPSFVINATTAEHVRLGIDFARENNIRLVVKSTGHDYIGRSVAPDSLSIWIHHLNNISLHSRGFKLAGSERSIEGKAITVGGGAQVRQIVAAAAKQDLVAVVGSCRTVGVGGYATSGGHSILSPRHGLAADNVLQIEVVTPSGAILKVNQDRNADLFWALRGGGGSTFGVITSLTMKAYPTPKVLSIKWIALADPKSPFIWDLISYLLSEFPSLMKKGFSGYNVLTANLQTAVLPKVLVYPGVEDGPAGLMGTMILQDVDDSLEVERRLQNLNDTIRDRWNGAVRFEQQTTPYETYSEWYEENYWSEPIVNAGSYLASRLLNESALTGNQGALTEAVKSVITANGLALGFMVGGEGVSNGAEAQGGNSVNPHWRNTYVHFITRRAFPLLNDTAELEAIETLNTSMQPIRELSPVSGACINEAFPYEQNWQEVFWGDNYSRLRAIKTKIDPDDVFWCFACVGSENWKELEDGRLCKINGSTVM